MLIHWCPGCQERHMIRVNMGEDTPHPKWDWNHDALRPTLTPSVRHFDGDGTFCHYFIVAGKIQYCGDCRHQLTGQTVDLPDIPGSEIAGEGACP